jgi:hypothetical protein
MEYLPDATAPGKSVCHHLVGQPPLSRSALPAIVRRLRQAQWAQDRFDGQLWATGLSLGHAIQDGLLFGRRVAPPGG